jgi:polyisoprenoid-binding protein YceI
MVVHGGHHQIGPERGQILLRTGRDGMVAQAGHDLVIEVRRWSGELIVNDDLSVVSVDVQFDMSSLAVLEGIGGLKPLTDRDLREIAVTARKILGIERNPQARFTASDFRPDTRGSGVLAGTLTVAGNPGPLSLQVRQSGPDKFQATGEVVQTAYAITPYRGFLGALKVRDAVGVEAHVDLSEPGPGASP